jgi:uncharacterized protein YhhL (DUF1145 family)
MTGQMLVMHRAKLLLLYAQHPRLVPFLDVFLFGVPTSRPQL